MLLLFHICGLNLPHSGDSVNEWTSIDVAVFCPTMADKQVSHSVCLGVLHTGYIYVSVSHLPVT